MKNTKSTASLQDQLQQLRQEQLDGQVIGTLRSHGKLWGMDVFSWYKPNAFELENTLSSFPSPICWFGNQSDMLNLLSRDHSWLSNVKLLCSFDAAGFSLSNKVLDQVDEVLGTAEIQDALKLIKSLKKNQGILLFTASGENWNEYRVEFESFLKLNQ